MLGGGDLNAMPHNVRCMHAVVWKVHGYCPKNSVFYKVRRSPTPWRPLLKCLKNCFCIKNRFEPFSRGLKGVGGPSYFIKHWIFWPPEGSRGLFMPWNQNFMYNLHCKHTFRHLKLKTKDFSKFQKQYPCTFQTSACTHPKLWGYL